MALSLLCTVIPDADVLGYYWLYIPYNSFWGHRGFFHSLVFAALLSLIIVITFYRRQVIFSERWRLLFYFFLLAASHGVLDALTNGGQGIALLSPFSNHRYFFPWTPLEVSPLGIQRFLSQRGLAVLINEVVWIWLPSFFFGILLLIITQKNRTEDRKPTSGNQ